MDRRTFLTLSTSGILSALTGCSIGAQGDSRFTSTTTEITQSQTATSTETIQTQSPTPNQSSGGNQRSITSIADVDLPVPKSKLVRGANKDDIPAITEPVFSDDWSGLTIAFFDPYGDVKKNEPRLNPDDRVIGLEHKGIARAYPLRVLNWHEIVNDTFGGQPLMITYCPLCATGMAAKRMVNGEATIFGVSGFLWNSNLVMYDKLTKSYWSQAAATAIRGPKTGERLSLVPATLTTMNEWRKKHPETKVLLPPPKSGVIKNAWPAVFNYKRNPYEHYLSDDTIGIGENTLPEGDARLHPKTKVLGIRSEGVAKAYPFEAVQQTGVVNDTVGNLPVVVTVAPDETTLVAYDRRVDGSSLHFSKVSSNHLRGGGSRWKIVTGRAVDGPHQGTALTPATNTPQLFWFAWLDFNPDTAVYKPQT
ncbi:MAG: DUF3179 domain-containing protein [Halobacteriales archaeon]